MSALARNELPSPPLAPGGEAIDLEHLSRMTLGDRSLEREILALFARQAEILLPRMDGAAPAVAAAAAHTLKGSAVGVGAWRIARAAEVVEQADAAKLPDAIHALGEAVADTAAEIAVLLQAR